MMEVLISSFKLKLKLLDGTCDLLLILFSQCQISVLIGAYFHENEP